MIHDVDDSNRARVQAFLEAHVETSLLLLANLESLGPRQTGSPYSGNFRFIEDAGQVAAVFCLTRSGSLLLQTGGRTDFTQCVLEACAREPMRIEGILGEWEGAHALWSVLLDSEGFRATHGTRDVLYRLRLTPKHSVDAPTRLSVRSLTIADFDQWDPHIDAFLAGEGLPNQATTQERIAAFELRVWWGAFDGPTLVSTASLNARYRDTGQIGGVYTKPEYRQRGYARAVMQRLMRDSREQHGLGRLVLFTGERSRAARAMYESLGFELAGSFALLFGAWS